MKYICISIFAILFFSCGAKHMQTQVTNCNLRSIGNNDFKDLFFDENILNRLDQINEGILIYKMVDGMSTPKIIELKKINNKFVTNSSKVTKIQEEFLTNKVSEYFSKINDDTSIENYLSQCKSNSTHQSLLVFFVKKKNKRLCNFYSMNGMSTEYENASTNLKNSLEIVDMFQ